MAIPSKPCDRDGCEGAAVWSRYCGAHVCDACGTHRKLARCYCGWSASGGDGRRELVDMGETIGDEDPHAEYGFDYPFEYEGE